MSNRPIIDDDPNNAKQRRIYEANPRLLTGLRRHVLHGGRVGSFLAACIKNDLSGAVGKADEDSMRVLGAIVKYLFNDVDARCWGSEDSYVEWRRRDGMVGIHGEEDAFRIARDKI